MMKKKYKLAALGGTFDYLHIGHQHLLDVALEQADKVMVGLTRPKMHENKDYAGLITNYQTRQGELEQYLSQTKKPHQKIEIFPLEDIYGSTISNKQIEVVVVSEQTKAGAKVINQKRQELGMSQLPVVVADLIADEEGRYISSTRIRQGLINRQGQVYQRLFNKEIKITQEQKKLISKPQGKLIKKLEQLTVDKLKTYTNIGLVGDVVTQHFIKNKLPFDIAIIDHQINRQSINFEWNNYQTKHRYQTTNPAGTINPKAAKLIHQIVNKQQSLIEVEGEEDLLGFPLALSLPLNSVLIYGQPREGMVIMELTEKKKNEQARIIGPGF